MDIRKILNLSYNEIEIHLELNNSNIILTIKEKINSSSSSEEYIEKYSYESIKELNIYFNIFENIKEIYEDITNHLENKQFNYIKENNKITLIIKTKVGIKNFEIPLICAKCTSKNETIETKEVVNNINISNINEKINKLENNLNNISKSQINTENNINKIFEILNKLNISNELIISQKDKFFDVPSLICEQNNEINFLKNLLPNKKLTLLYRATKDGDSFDNFHSKCDNQGETITFIKTVDGRKFGGHMNQSILTGIENWFNKNDENFFLFSLNQLKCYRPTSDCCNKNGCFHSDEDQGPIFGNSNSNVGIYGKSSILCNEGGTEFKIKDMGITEDYVFSGKSKFTAKELEVYKIQ